MRLLTRSQLRFVVRSPWSTATALLGVALGVASVVAVHLISVQVVRSLDETEPPHLAGLTHVLDAPGLDADAYFDLRSRWRQRPDSALRALVPVVEGRALMDGQQIRVLGADWLAMPADTAWEDAGALTVSDDVLVGAAVLADASLGWGAGGTVTIGGREFRVAEARSTSLGAAVLADIAAAQVMIGASPQTVSRIGMAVEDPWQAWRRWLDRLMPGFGAGLPALGAGSLGSLVPGLADGDSMMWQASPVAAQRPSAEFARAVLFNLGALGTLALLVAWFLIYQVGVIWLRRQHLLLQRLEVVGVSEAALRRSFLSVFLAIGSLATVLGIVLGTALASILTGLASQGIEGADPRSAGFADLDVWVLVKAFVSGLGVCLVGGLGAFSREWRERRWSPWWGRLLPPVLLTIMAAGILLDRTGVLGGFLAIFAMSMAGVALVAPALWLLRRLVARTGGSPAARLALRDVAWYPRMLGVALAALSLAVATGIGISLMVESFRSDFERMLSVRLAGDLYLEIPGADVRALRAWIEEQDAVTRTSWFGSDRVEMDGVPVELGFAEFDAAESARYGFPRPLAAGEALVSERVLRDLDLAHGDTLAVANGSLAVVGRFPGFGDPRGRVLVDVASLDLLGVKPRFDRLTLHVASGRAGALRRALESRFPAVEAESRREVRAAALRIFDRTFAITRALTLLAVLVAVVGTYNALTALRLHQAPTTALLRAQGMTSAEIRGIALVRAATLGGIAMLLALPLGLAMAWTLCAVINPRSFGWTVELHLPVSAWLPPLLLGALAAILAGALPAPRERGAVHEGA